MTWLKRNECYLPGNSTEIGFRPLIWYPIQGALKSKASFPSSNSSKSFFSSSGFITKTFNKLAAPGSSSFALIASCRLYTLLSPSEVSKLRWAAADDSVYSGSSGVLYKLKRIFLARCHSGGCKGSEVQQCGTSARHG